MVHKNQRELVLVVMVVTAYQSLGNTVGTSVGTGGAGGAIAPTIILKNFVKYFSV